MFFITEYSLVQQNIASRKSYTRNPSRKILMIMMTTPLALPNLLSFPWFTFLYYQNGGVHEGVLLSWFFHSCLVNFVNEYLNSI